MAEKLTKNVIKDIVKECLIEILAEGLASDKPRRKQKRTLHETMTRQSAAPSSRKSKKPSYLENISKNDKLEENSLRKNQKLDVLAASITADPILSEMLADTAHTTLQEQLAADSKKGYTPTGAGDTAQRMVENNSPEELFGEEASSKWASLAFG